MQQISVPTELLGAHPYTAPKPRNADWQFIAGMVAVYEYARTRGEMRAGACKAQSDVDRLVAGFESATLWFSRMRFQILATDYDGTLAYHGKVDEETIAGLNRFKDSGRRLVMVTGRELEELKQIFHRLDLFEFVVAENGALLYSPSSGKVRLLCEPVSHHFVDALRRCPMEPLSVGHVIVATQEPNEILVLETIKNLGLELEVIFNKGSVMILPTGVNKATGLKAGLKEMDVSPQQVVAIGDAENDHAFLSICGCGVAVSNALPALKERACYVTRADHGRGVVELMDLVVATDLEGIAPAASLSK